MNKKAIMLLGVLLLLGLFLFIHFSHSSPPDETADPSGETQAETVTDPEPTQEQDENAPDPAPSDTPDSPEDGQEPTPPPSADQAAGQARVDAIIGEIYALRSSYSGQLAAIEASGVSQYQSLPDDQKSEAVKQSIASSCISQANALEGQCDAQMNRLCSELGLVLLEMDGDLTLVNEVRHTYVAEKAARKNAFLATYSAYM